MLRIIALLLTAVILIGLIALKVRESTSTSFTLIGEYAVEGNAEIIAATPDGLYIVHTNSKNSSVDLVEIADPANPSTVISIPVPGEPTSVGISPDGLWAMAVVFAAQSKAGKKPVDPRLPGLLALIDLRNPQQAAITKLIGIGHHPDSIAIASSGDELHAIIAIENEPLIVTDNVVIDNDKPGQKNDISKPGAIEIISLNPLRPERYTSTTIPLDQATLSDALMLFPEDPQPEYVAIAPNKKLAAISLQENNGIVLIDPVKAEIVSAFNLGKSVTQQADLIADGKVSLVQNYPDDAVEQPYAGVRFPDAVAFHPNGRYLITADEGEFKLSGGRGFSIWSIEGGFVWDDAGEIEREAAKLDLYPEERSDVRGVEVEGVTTARFSNADYAFLLSERGSFVAIYDISNPKTPVFIQIIPTSTAPESAVAIPSRNLLVIAGEKDGALTLIEGPAK